MGVRTKRIQDRMDQRVAVMMSGLGCWGEIISGIAEYALSVQNWQIKIFPSSLVGLRAALNWGGRGLLVRIADPALCRKVMQSKLPAVNVSTRLENIPLPLVGSDNLSIGRMAADFFLNRKFQNFAYFHLADRWFSRVRYQGFKEHLGACGVATPVYCLETTNPENRQFEIMEPLVDVESVQDWLQSLPKPVALFACSDYMGIFLVRLSIKLGFRVPEEIYVLGVDNVVGEMTYPPMSSVETAKHEIGYRAAKMLDQLLDGQKLKDRTVLIPPLRVVDRHFSQSRAVPDPEVWAARQFIQYHADEQISVSQVVEAVGVSRRSLETKFKNQQDCTILEEIHRVHMERAQELLASTDWSVERVAKASGFHSAAQLWLVMQAKLGVSPSVFRQRKGRMP